jgi:hypothetical protein
VLITTAADEALTIGSNRNNLPKPSEGFFFQLKEHGRSQPGVREDYGGTIIRLRRCPR